MVIQPDTSSADGVILRVLQETQATYGRPIYRTALVKLVYLVDYIYAQHTGHTLTGFDYIWDDHGPNAVGNLIVKRADRLQSPGGAVAIEKGVTPAGNPKYLYRLVAEGEGVPLHNALGEQVIRDVIMTYGNLNWSAIVKAARSTSPHLRAKPGDRLDLSPDPEKRQRLAGIQAKLSARQYESDRPGVSIGEIKTRYGLSTG